VLLRRREPSPPRVARTHPSFNGLSSAVLGLFFQGPVSRQDLEDQTGSFPDAAPQTLFGGSRTFFSQAFLVPASVRNSL